MKADFTSDAIAAVLTAQVVGGNGYGISHSWDGTVLTVTSDSGTIAADLRGPAGAQGEPGPAGADGRDAALFAVTLTQEDDDRFRADRPFGQVQEAIQRGDRVVAVWEPGNGETMVFPVFAYGESTVYFQGDYMGSASLYFRMYGDGSVVRTAVPYCKLPAVGAEENGKVLTVSGGVWKAEALPEAEEAASPKAVSVAVVREGNAVTVTAAYDDGGTSISVIALDENDYPLSVTTDGHACSISWEGFDA